MLSQPWELYKATVCLSRGLGRNSVCNPGVTCTDSLLLSPWCQHWAALWFWMHWQWCREEIVFQSPWVLCKLSLGTASLARPSCSQFYQGLWIRDEFHDSISVLSCSESSPAHLPALGAIALLKLKGQVYCKPEVRWLCKLPSKDAANKHWRRQTKVP